MAGFDVLTKPAEVRRRIGLTGQHAAIDGWRYWLGLALLVLSLILPILALIFVPLFGYPEGVFALGA